MATTCRKIRVLAGFLATITLYAMPMLGDTHEPLASAMPEFHCYCQCEAHGGRSICPKQMCELPKYEKRWWAISCHKRETNPSASQAPASHPTEPATGSILDAKR